MADQAPTSGISVDELIARELLLDTEPQKAARRRLADDMLYDLSRPYRELNPDNVELAYMLDGVVAMPSEERDELLRQSDRIAEQLLKPLAYKVLELRGLDPSIADPEAVRQALQSPITPEEQHTLQEEYNRAFEETYGPMVADALEDAGIRVDRRDPEQVWEEFERHVKSLECEEKAPAPSTVSVGVPAALVGGLVTLCVTQFVSWIRRRQRRRRRAGSTSRTGTTPSYDGSQFSEDSQMDME